MTTTSTRNAIADLIDKAAKVIEANGYCGKYLYDTRQADGGTDPANCRVDILGALNIAANGTPRYTGNGATVAAEKAIAARIDAPSIVTWMDYAGNGKDAALTLLRETAAELREGN